MTSAILILMAGNSRRMGCLKAIMTVRDKPMLAHSLDTARAVCAGDIVLLLGHEHETVRRVVDTSGARVVVNTDPDRGMASSLALGIGAMGPGVDRVAVLLGDQPNVDATLLRRLLDLHAASGRDAAAVSCAGVVMPPVVLSGRFLKAALHAVGDLGLRETLRAQVDSIAVLPVEEAIVQDVDIPEDLERAQRWRD